MADLQLLNPNKSDKSGLVNIVHLAGRFPSRILTNNVRVDQGYTKFSYQFLDRKDFTAEKILRNPILSACIDLDQFLLFGDISLDKIDTAISSFRKSNGQSENPQDYLPFLAFARPVYSYLIDWKKHDVDSLLG